MVIRKAASGLLLAMAGLAVWRASEGDVTEITNVVWGIIETGAAILTQVWTTLTSNL